MTFSIAARDGSTGEVGIAVQSCVPAVGAIVPHGVAGAGVIALQSMPDVGQAPKALAILEETRAPEAVVSFLTANSAFAKILQVGIVALDGGATTFTGENCLGWAGGIQGEDYCCQGNILAGRRVIEAMERAFLSGGGGLGNRLLHALDAGETAGGDIRGQQSAALLIIRKGWGFMGSDRFRDLRVDDHPTPIKELRRLLDVHCEAFPGPWQP
jgi:uncharacterized Ntn-hydrolase superfamily protein